MKLFKNAASGKTTIKMSKEEWLAIGKKAGWNNMEHENYDYINGKRKIRKMTNEQIAWNIDELKEVIEIQEKARKEGYNTPKLGYYQDELLAYLEEKKRRREE